LLSHNHSEHYSNLIEHNNQLFNTLVDLNQHQLNQFSDKFKINNNNNLTNSNASNCPLAIASQASTASLISGNQEAIIYTTGSDISNNCNSALRENQNSSRVAITRKDSSMSDSNSPKTENSRRKKLLFNNPVVQIIKNLTVRALLYK
jgi:hypothetical protein